MLHILLHFFCDSNLRVLLPGILFRDEILATMPCICFSLVVTFAIARSERSRGRICRFTELCMLAVLRQSEPLIRWPLVLQDPWTPDETMVRKKFDHYDKDRRATTLMKTRSWRLLRSRLRLSK